MLSTGLLHALWFIGGMVCGVVAVVLALSTWWRRR
jgi:hypothetical protein